LCHFISDNFQKSLTRALCYIKLQFALASVFNWHLSWCCPAIDCSPLSSFSPLMALSSLPDEVLGLVLRLLPPQSLCRMEKCSRRFSSLVDSLAERVRRPLWWNGLVILVLPYSGLELEFLGAADPNNETIQLTTRRDARKEMKASYYKPWDRSLRKRARRNLATNKSLLPSKKFSYKSFIIDDANWLYHRLVRQCFHRMPFSNLIIR